LGVNGLGGWVKEFYVVPEHRRRGFGAKF